LAREKNISIQQVPSEKLFSLAKGNHQGVIGFASQVHYLALQEVISNAFVDGSLPLFLLLDGITDVRNIGAMARTALCCGAQALIIPDKGVGALNEDALKSSAGALTSIQICRVNSLLKAIDELHLHGIKVFTSEMNAPRKVYEMEWNQPLCIVMGSEGRGVQSYLSKAADDHFSIPMAGKFDSFNVSVAAGIILYEAMKHRLMNS
jgi:23S rRNA (guanosine2251-2'-O)-methyltransferase